MWQQIQNRNPVTVPSNVNNMEDVLKSIHSEIIKLDANERKQYSKTLGEIILDKLISAMKKDEVFKALFKKVNFSGSYYENLRVKKPDEFDLNLIIQLPKEFQPIKIVQDNVRPGFAHMKMINPPLFDATQVQRKIKRFLDDKNFIKREAVLSWLQGVVDTALRCIDWKMEMLDPWMSVGRSRSGPAVTLNVTYGINKSTFSVDLVPVFGFDKDSWPARPMRQLTSNLDSRDLEWFIVPKGPRSGDVNGTQWRMSFYTYERKIMGNLQNMKPTAKILKLLRDAQGWYGLSSYYIKTVFLWEMTNQEHTGLFWRKSMSYLFYHMLCVLENCVASHYIPFFWHEKCNLLQHISSSTTENWAYRISKIRKDIDRRLNNPEDLKTYFNSIVKRDNQQQFVRANSSAEVSSSDNSSNSFQQQQQGGNGGLAFGITLGAAAVGIIAVGVASMFMAQRNNNNNRR